MQSIHKNRPMVLVFLLAGLLSMCSRPENDDNNTDTGSEGEDGDAETNSDADADSDSDADADADTDGDADADSDADSDTDTDSDTDADTDNDSDTDTDMDTDSDTDTDANASCSYECVPRGSCTGTRYGGLACADNQVCCDTSDNGNTDAVTDADTDIDTDTGTDIGGSDGAAVFEGKELFILFGQSNMSGMSPMPKEPWPINENITFMVQYDCPSLDQTKDEWLPAEPPLHGCQWATGGIGLGLADYFGVAMAEAWPTAQIGLIPNAIPAVTIDVFMKNGPSPGGGMKALPDGYTNAYALMVDRVKEAQKIGRVRGILLHQGESDYNQGFEDEWLGKLTTIIADLRTDLALGEEVPFIAGEISPESSWSGHNVYVNQVPDAIPHSAVVPAEGTHIHDVAHFDEESARVMGQRYAQTFLELIGEQQ